MMSVKMSQAQRAAIEVRRRILVAEYLQFLEESKNKKPDPNEWNSENAINLCRKFDTFCVKDIAKTILQGELSGESLDDEMYNCISDNCFDALFQVIQNGLVYMNVCNRREFKIRDFKNGLISYTSGMQDGKSGNLPSCIPLDESLKFALAHL